jgi:paraquat-inducible protein A
LRARAREPILAPAMLKACPCCGLVQRLDALPPRHRARCARCGLVIAHPARSARSNRRVFAAALAALVLYPVAISLPIMRLERFGHSTEASVWTGSVGLLRQGEVAVGAIVLVCSVLVPLGKLGGLLAITGLRARLSRRQRARAFRWIELSGRWGMLDVLLIAVVVAWLKVGDLVSVEPGPAAFAFTVCVLLSLLASAWFDPHALWDERPEA